jgi:hypothetical protein
LTILKTKEKKQETLRLGENPRLREIKGWANRVETDVPLYSKN